MFKEKLSLVPELPGSYQMRDKNGTIISACYVNSNEGHSFYASSHNIFFFDKMETGKSIKTTQASYKNTKFY